MQKFFVGQRVSVLVPNHEFTGTIVRVIADSGACGGVYEVKPDHRPLDPDCDFQAGDNLALLGDHLKPHAKELNAAEKRLVEQIDARIRELTLRCADKPIEAIRYRSTVILGMVTALVVLIGYEHPESVRLMDATNYNNA